MPPVSQPNPRFPGYSNFGQGTPKVVPVSTGSTQLLAANSARLYAEVNNIGLKAIWVQLGIPATVGRGKRVLPGGMLTFTDNELFLGNINAVCESGTVNTDVIEGVS